jgi:predicted Zn-dependent peptidase
MKRLIAIAIAILNLTAIGAQNSSAPFAKTIEFDLKNGLHVIICRDTTSPIVNVGVMYHVGSKNERADRTGFAHLFEHLLFNGTKNIPEGEMENYMREAGGYSNANTSADRTYYYTILPSNQLRLGLWIESERMLHPIISEKVIAREKEVVKEESRQRYDTNPLGRVPEKMQAFEYKEYSYRWPVVGSMEHLDAASTGDFQEFFNKFYVPNNAALVITGDVDVVEAKKYINAYFNRIPKGKPVIQPVFNEKFISGEVKIDSIVGLKDMHMVVSYKTVPETHKDAITLGFINSHLTFDAKAPFSSIDKTNPGVKKISSTTEMYEKAGSFWFRSSFKDSLNYQKVVDIIDRVINELADNGLDERRLSQLKQSYESGFTDMFFDMPFLADVLAISYLEWGDTQRVNRLIRDYVSITNEDIKRVMREYFTAENRKIMVIYPKK